MHNYIFVDDGYPEADEYDNNYIAYDPADAASVTSALREARARAADVGGLRMGSFLDRARRLVRRKVPAPG